jgi:flavoprotein
MPRKNSIKPDEAIMNLLVLELLVNDVDMKLIEKATRLDQTTIYKRFPMKLVKAARAKAKSRIGAT